MIEPWRRVYLGFFTDVNSSVDHLSIPDVTNLSELELMFSAPIEDLNDALETKTFDLLVETMSRGADASVDAKGNLRALKVGASFDKNNSAAVTSARKQAAKLVKDVSAETRKAIRETIYNGYKEQQTVRQITKTLQNVVGMNRQQASAWQKVYGKIPNSAEAKRAAQLAVKQRALSIARTETIRASNEGQLQLWQQRIAKGLLPPTSTRVWITTPDEKLCPICAALDGGTVKMNELFEGNHKVPPAHPNCRCTIALRFSPDIAAPAAVNPELLKHDVVPTAGSKPLDNHVMLQKHPMFDNTVIHSTFKDYTRESIVVKRVAAVHREMTRLTTEFPKLAEVKIDALHLHDTGTITTESWGPNFKAAGFYSRRFNQTSVHVVMRASGSYDKDAVHIGNGRWTVGTNSIRDTLRHEVGHAVHLTHFQRIRGGAQARSEWETIWGKYSKNKQLIHDRISQYAATNDMELFAESFGAYTHPAYDIQGPRFSYGGPVLKRLPDDIHNYMEKYIGKRVPMQQVGAPPIAPPIARPVPPVAPPVQEVIVKPPSGKVGRQNATGFLTTVDYDNIRIRARSGDKVAEIANDFNISTTRVRGIIKAGEEKVKEIIGGGPDTGDKGPEIIKTPDNDVKPGDDKKPEDVKPPEDKKPEDDTKGPKITAVMREEIIQLIKSGQPVSVVAKKYGISPTYARKLYLRSIGAAA